MVLVAFAGGGSGTWRVISLQPVKGEPLPHVPYVSVLEGVSAAAAAPAAAPSPCDAEAAERSSGSGSSGGSSSSAWVLHGVTSNLRYTSGEELAAMVAVQEGLGRPAATLAALIPIRKSPAWWALPQDARLGLMASSRHIPIGMEALPGVARRLHHCRDLGGPGVAPAPFDFLTWFEYAPAHAGAFERMVAELRATEEWTYVDREVDLRLERVA